MFNCSSHHVSRNPCSAICLSIVSTNHPVIGQIVLSFVPVLIGCLSHSTYVASNATPGKHVTVKIAFGTCLTGIDTAIRVEAFTHNDYSGYQMTTLQNTYRANAPVQPWPTLGGRAASVLLSYARTFSNLWRSNTRQLLNKFQKFEKVCKL